MKLSAKQIMQRMSRLESDRAQYEEDWRFIADYFNPARSVYFDKGKNVPKQKDWKYSGDGEMYSEKMASSFSAYSFPKRQQFFEIDFFGLLGEPSTAVREFSQELEVALHEVVTATETKFHDNIPEVLRDCFDFGLGVLYEEDATGLADLRYTRWGLHSVWVDVDHYGENTAIAHKYRLTAEAAYDAFGEAVCAKVKKDTETDPQSRSDYLHFIYKIDENKWAHVHLCTQDTKILSSRVGKSSQVYTVRHRPDTDSAYSFGIGFAALNDMDRLNDIAGDTFEASDLNLRPPILAANEDHLAEGYLQPRQIYYSDFENGRPQIAPLNVGGNLPFTLEHEAHQSKKVGDRYHYQIWQLAMQKGISATQFSDVREMHDQELAPLFHNIVSQIADPILHNALRQMFQAEAMYWLQRMPPEILELDGIESVRFRYTSPMAGSVKVRKAMALQRSLDGVSSYANVSGDTAILDNIDSDRIPETLFDAFNAPMSVLRDPDEVSQLREGRAAAQQEQQQLDAAPGMAKAMQEVSQIGGEQ